MDNRAFTAPGELVADHQGPGVRHVRRFGESGPVLLFECGLTLMSSCWGWLAPCLANFTRVITYDRAGLGWSIEREEPRDACQLAAELAVLLQALEVTEPVVLVSHSMGAMIHRAFLLQQPDRVQAIIWLDPAHPEQILRRGIRRRMRNLLFYIEAARLLAARGVPAIEVPLTRHLDGLPEREFRALRRFLRNPAHLRTCAREARAWQSSAEYLRTHETAPVDLPLLLLSAQKNALPHWPELQADLATWSPQARHRTFTAMSHLSMLAQREHAAEIAECIGAFLKE